MILHLTAGSTHIALEIIDEAGAEPSISVLPQQLTLAAPAERRVVKEPRRLLTFAAVATAAALGGYHFAPGTRENAPVTQARAQPAYVAQSAAAVDDSPQVPAQLRRELAGPPVITAPPGPSAPAKPGDSNPFGLE